MASFDLNPASGIAKEVMSGLDGLFTSDNERMQAEAKIKEIVQKPHILQAMANIEGAKHKSIFVAGWRPAIGWVCAIGLGYQFLVLPFAGLVSAFVSPEVVLPSLESEGLIAMVMSLLGLGGLRTVEKAKGVASNSMKNDDPWPEDGD